MKLINKDRLSTQVAELFVQPNISYWQICSLVENAPAVDPIHAAGGCYCRECKYYGNEDKHPYGGECSWWKGLCEPEDFCSYGRKREDV